MSEKPHPIQAFVDSLFEDKPQEKRIKWAASFIEEEYESPQELGRLSDEDWKTFKLPQKIESVLKTESRKLVGGDQETKEEQVPEKEEVKKPEELPKEVKA